MKFCKPWSDFSLDIFFPGLKIIDFMKENMVLDEGFYDEFVYAFRLVDIIDGQFIDTDFICEVLSFHLKEDTDEIYGKFDHLCEENRHEFEMIYQVMVNRGFIRTDDFFKSCLVAFIIDNCRLNPIKSQIDEYMIKKKDFNIYYESVKPMTAKELRQIQEILKEELSPSQSEILRFYISKTDRHSKYEFTTTEKEALEKACINIRRARSAVTMINKIMDDTLITPA